MPERIPICLLLILVASTTEAGVRTYGDKDGLGTFAYPEDPTTGATLEGLDPDIVTVSTVRKDNHGYPFSPENDDFPGTDQIYVGNTQTTMYEGYSQYFNRLQGPQVIQLDYADLVPGGHSIDTLTLGVGADDFQYVLFRQPYTATMNGDVASALTSHLNTLNQTGPDTQFFTIGIDPSILTPDHVLTLGIDQGGTGGDGWAIDFLTVGVTTTVPEPATIVLLLGMDAFGLARRRRCPGDTPKALCRGTEIGWRRRIERDEDQTRDGS